jgi:gas vesicle protein
MANEQGAGGPIVTAFVLGALTGAAFALLWAPASGEETRRLLREKADEAKGKANDAARQGRDFLDRQRESLNTAVERGKEAYQRARGGVAEDQA